jgi:CubicO group peptidase (beta-lactamase class C family)
MSLASRLDTVIDQAIGKTIAGSHTIVAVDGEIVYQRVAGLMGQDRPLQPRTIFRLASVTKPIVSAAAIAMVDQGRMKLDDPVTRYLPGFRPKLADGSEPVITLHHLMTHTSGISYAIDPVEKPEEPASNGIDGIKVGMADNLVRIGRLPLGFQPGTQWAYGVNIDVLGGIMEVIEGKSLPDIVRHYVTDPLGMADTDFHIVDPSRLSVAYADGVPPHVMADPETVVRPDGSQFTFSPGRLFDSSVFPSGGAGMAGSAEDFLTFMEAMRKGGAPILSRKSMPLLTQCAITPLSTDVEGRGFSHGWSIYRDPVKEGSPVSPGTWGWGGVYGHSWRVDPARAMTIVSFTNTAVEGCNGAFPEHIVRAVYDA